MADKTGIEWTDATWNPVTGCTKVSPGCDHCYAETFAERFRGVPGHHFEQGFDLVLRPERLNQPIKWTKPKRIFVNSMSDLFHESVPDGYIAQVWEVMARCPQHTFQVLTKRHGRMRSWLKRWHDTTGDELVEGAPMPRGPEAVREVYSSPRALLFADMLESMGTPPEGYAYPLYDWMEGPRWYPEVLPNVWVGVSVENQQWADIRVPALLETPAAVRFLSCEPLLGPVDLRGRVAFPRIDAPKIDWVIVGGESGRDARPMHYDWVRSLRDQCTAAGVPFLFKQWGEWRPLWSFGGVSDSPAVGDKITITPAFERVGKKKAGRELDGRTWDEFPQAVFS